MKDIKDFNYQTNDYGDIYSMKTGKVLKSWLNKKGYPVVCLAKDGMKVTRPVHRLVAETLILNPLNLPEVNHLDGIKTNCHVSNLEWSTSSDNQKHAYKHGLKIGTGINNGNHILTEQDVHEIRVKYKPRIYTQQTLANEYGVKKRTIEKIIEKQTWTHI